MPPRFAVVAALLALAAVPHSTAWTQEGGGAGHNSVAALSQTPLDVVATWRVDATPEEAIHSSAAGIVLTPYGPTGIVGAPVTPTYICQLFRVADVETGLVQRFGATVACPNGARMLAYVQRLDALLLEIDGGASDPMLQLWSARTGEVLWAVPPGVAGAELPAAQDAYDWYLDAAALDDAGEVAYVAFSQEGTGRHRIQARTLDDGSVRWSATIPTSIFVEDAPTLPTLLSESPGDASFEIFGLALTSDGLVVSGYTADFHAPEVDDPYSVPALAWLDLEGRVVGGMAARPSVMTEVEAVRFPPHSDVVALGAIAAAFHDGQLAIIDPINAGATLVPVSATEALVDSVPMPAWSREALVVPLHTSAIVYPMGDTSQPRFWPGYEGSAIRTMIIAPPGDAYAIVSRQTKDGGVADLLRIDLATARTIDRLPLPFAAEDVDTHSLWFLPLGDGRLLTYSSSGAVALLAPAPEHLRPQIEIDNTYPAAGQEFGLVASVGGDLREMTVAWGDGVLDRGAPGARLLHAYELPGRRVVRVVAVYPDNRTGTAEAVVHVGFEPPQELNLMQKAFAPEYQEITFFALGLAATGIGGLFALRGRFRRRSRLSEDLARLDEIRARGRADPTAAIADLMAFRATIKRDLAEGGLDDGQYTALTAEAVRLLRSMRLRLLGDLEGKLSAKFRQLLETALEDGDVTATEAQALRAALEGEKRLAQADRARLAALFDLWAAATPTDGA